MLPHRAPSVQGAFGGDADRIGRHLERGDGEPVEVRLPGLPVGEMAFLMLGQQPDDRAGERALAHVGQGLGIDRIIAMAGAQQLEEVGSK